MSNVYYGHINNEPHLSGHFAGMWNGRNEWQELLDGKRVGVNRKAYEGAYDVPFTYVQLLNGVVEVWEENWSWGYQNYKVDEIPLEQVLQENAPIVLPPLVEEIYIPNIYIQPDPEILDFTTEVTFKQLDCVSIYEGSDVESGWGTDEEFCDRILIGHFKLTEWKALLAGSTGTLKDTDNNRWYNIRFNNQTNYSSEYSGGPIGAFTGTFVIREKLPGSDSFTTIAYIPYEQVVRDNAPLGEVEPPCTGDNWDWDCGSWEHVRWDDDGNDWPGYQLPIPTSQFNKSMDIRKLNDRWAFYGFEEDTHLVGRFTPAEWAQLQTGTAVVLGVAGESENKDLGNGLQIMKAPGNRPGYVLFDGEQIFPVLLSLEQIAAENAPLSGGAVLSDAQLAELANGSRVYVDESLYYEYLPATDTLRLINEIDGSVVKQGTFKTVLQVNKDGSAVSDGSGILLALGVVGIALSMSNRKSK